ncbi:uncharacterized protein [Hoplias malabaricus]|uniref:uncharacterized protein n=1 Tax=Hoplias malabaricus TaxID=27720 RepID=UPI003461AC8F
MDPVIQHLLEASLQHQAATQELARGVRALAEDLLATRLAPPVPTLPSPKQAAHHLLMKLAPEDDVEAYLHTFEIVAEREVWDRELWVEILAPFLSGEAQLAYYSLAPDHAHDYDQLKREILARVGLSPAAAAMEYHRWTYQPGQTPRQQMLQLLRTTRRWLRPELRSSEEVAEHVAMERFLRTLPTDLRRAVAMRDSVNPRAMVEATEAAERMLGLMRADRPEAASLARRDRFLIRRTPPKELEGARGPRPSRLPTPPNPHEEPMPTEPELGPLPRPAKTWLAGCGVHGNFQKDGSHRLLHVDGRPVRAFMDSGSTVTLLRPAEFPWLQASLETLPVTCVHGEVRQFPTARVLLGEQGRQWPLTVGLVPDLPVPLLVGRDFPGFAQGHNQFPSRQRRHHRKCRSRARSALLARPQGDSAEASGEGECQGTINPLSSLCQQIQAEGGFAREQREDDRLKRAWENVAVLDGVPHVTGPLPDPHFAVHKNLLYRVRQLPEGPQEALVLPRSRIDAVMHLAHHHPLGGHLAWQNTLARILPRFYWPSIQAEVKNYCQRCARCQLTSPKKPPPAPLIPLPIIGVPFERIGMDIVGPLPKSGRGHEYILVMVDYATRYPEAVPLRKATSKAIAQELFLLCSRVGIPKDIITDQGTPFVSRLVADLCKLLRIKHLPTSVYHPQTDGLVERCNQTLKRMLKKVVAQDGRDWDLLVPYVLFAVREVPQASTGFSPFELLYSRRPRGLLDVVREAWEQQPSPYRSIIEYVQEMQQRVDAVAPIVQEHMEEAQRAQQCIYNRPAQPREFQVGDRVLVLVPTTTCKFLATWQGPYTIHERVGPVNYRLNQPGRRKTQQVYHVNLLKKWVEPIPQVSGFASTESSARAEIQWGDDLSPAQRQELVELVERFRDVFSVTPGRTQVVQHDIRTPVGVTVRQRPYRVPEARRTAIEEEVERMLSAGIIEPSNSPWSSPIVLVPKPDGSWRFCNDFRKLNEVSQFDSYPLPRVDDLIDRLGKARFISTLDLTKGYWQVALTPEARPKTAFSTPAGHWQYRVLPFGLHGAPATFQRLMDVVLRPLLPFAAAYLDDVIIHSETWSEHVDHLRRVLSRLREAGLTANPRKCHLGLTEAHYLGYRIGRGLLRPQVRKVEAILNCPKPRSKKQVRAFLGLAGYYRRFISNFSSIASPLSDLTRKGQPETVKWTPEAEAAFEQLKACLTSEPVLRSPDFNRPFRVQTDASERGLGAVLVQDFNGEEHPVLYISRKLTPPEQRYAALEREALAIKWAIEELRFYLTGRPFILVTDHAPLQWLARAKDSNPRVTRWFLSLQDFSFRVQHRAGVLHGNADALSRLPVCWASRGPLSDVSLRGGECGRGPSHQSSSSMPRQPSAPQGGVRNHPRLAVTGPSSSYFPGRKRRHKRPPRDLRGGERERG